MNEKDVKIELYPLRMIGSHKDGVLRMRYKDIIDKVFPPNVTDLDDEFKVKASWGFRDEDGRDGFIWCHGYNGDVTENEYWSVCGDRTLMRDIFGFAVEY
jgi:hypothetical protein